MVSDTIYTIYSMVSDPSYVDGVDGVRHHLHASMVSDPGYSDPGYSISSWPVRTRWGWSPTGTLATSRASSKEITDTRSCSLTDT